MWIMIAVVNGCMWLHVFWLTVAVVVGDLWCAAHAEHFRSLQEHEALLVLHTAVVDFKHRCTAGLLIRMKAPVVLRGLMRACTSMCIHIIWAWWLRSVTTLNNAMGMTDDRRMKVGHYVATLAVVAWYAFAAHAHRGIMMSWLHSKVISFETPMPTATWTNMPLVAGLRHSSLAVCKYGGGRSGRFHNVRVIGWTDGGHIGGSSWQNISRPFLIMSTQGLEARIFTRQCQYTHYSGRKGLVDMKHELLESDTPGVSMPCFTWHHKHDKSPSPFPSVQLVTVDSNINKSSWELAMGP